MGVSHLNIGVVLVLFILLVIISRTFRNPTTSTSLYLNGTSGGDHIPFVSHNKYVEKYSSQNMLLGPTGTCAITTKSDKCHCWNNVSEFACDDYAYAYQKDNNYKGHFFTEVLKCEDITNPTKCEIKN